MLNQVLITIYTRDLTKLKEELNAYSDESKMWKIEEGISNPAGNLALHLIGNINHFIGATLGNTGYVRDRDKEFTLKNIPRHQLIEAIDKTIAVVQDILGKLTPADLDKPYPIKVVQDGNSTQLILVNMLVHLDYHLGQINYHRRLVAK